MKKHLFLLSLALITITAFGQNSIPNGNFEQWTSSTFDSPQYYPFSSNVQNFFQYNLPFNVTQTTPGYHGMYAVQLTTNANATDTSFAYILNANPNSSGSPTSWTGGIPYAQMPVGVRGYYKYNVATADSATIIVVFSKAGVNIGTYFFPIGGIKNTYTLFDFNFNPALTQTPDSMIFGAISCKLTANTQKPHGPAGSTLVLDSVSFTGVSSQPAQMNGDFESWQPQTLNIPNNWYIQNGNGQGFNRTTDAAAGNYAVELITYLGNQNNQPAAQPGWISTGYYPNNCDSNCNELGGNAFTNQIDTLAFYYKYIPSGNDSANVSLNFIKNGSNFQGTGINLPASASYQYIEIPFNIGQAPDSVIVNIQSSIWNDTLLSFIGSDLKIDEIHFKSQPLNTGIINYNNNSTISIFPNPTNGKIQIQGLTLNIQSLEVYNILGEKVYATTNLPHQTLNEIDLSNLQKGIYFLSIYDGEKIYTKKIVLQ